MNVGQIRKLVYTQIPEAPSLKAADLKYGFWEVWIWDQRYMKCISDPIQKMTPGFSSAVIFMSVIVGKVGPFPAKHSHANHNKQVNTLSGFVSQLQ